MNSTERPFGLALRTLALAGALLANGTASAQDASSQLNFVRSLKSIYASLSTSSGAAAARADLNSSAQGSPDCQALMTSKENAAKNYIKNKLPPDPTTILQNTTCFLDVMEIQIPTSGIRFLDKVVGAITPYLKSEACNSTSGWWNDMKGKVSAGNFEALLKQQFAGAGRSFTPTTITGTGGTGNADGTGGTGGNTSPNGPTDGAGVNVTIRDSSYWRTIEELRRRIGLDPPPTP